MSISSLVQSIKASHESTPLTDVQITELSAKAGFQFPPSYRNFLKEFGNGDTSAQGIYQIFTQDLDAPDNSWSFQKAHEDAPDPVPVEGGSPVPMSSLYCLMTEDSNGGAWCWITSAADQDGEVPLAYYDPFKKKLFYPVPSFSYWLEILVRDKQEVIRSLDLDEKLGLG